MPTPNHSPEPNRTAGPARRYVVGVTGASGALYAKRVIAEIVRAGHECHLCVSPYGQRLLFDELGIEGLNNESLAALAELPPGTDPKSRGLLYHPSRDVGAAIGSGSFRHDGMVIVPCSSNTMNQVAHGTGDTLVTRAAAVALKERMKLIIAHREAPLTLIDIRAMETLTLSGAIVCPCNPGFYLLPTRVDQVIDFVAARLLDLLGVEHDLKVRWAEHLSNAHSGRSTGAAE